MANSAGVCNSFKSEVMTALHALGTTVTRGATTADTIMAALYLASASLSASTTAYSATGEVSGTGYVAGGQAVTNANAPSTSSGVGIWTPSANLVWSNVTLSTAFDTVLLYNSTQSNRAIAVYTFGSQIVTAGTFTLTMPSNTNTTALLRIS